MPTIYCLGGASRSGKTQVMRKFLTTVPIPAISTDSIRHLLKCLPDANNFPDLFAERPLARLSHEARAKLRAIDGERYVRLENLESSVVWPAVASYLEANTGEGIDMFVEGVAVLPQYVAALSEKIEVRAVFIGNQSSDHWRDMRSHAKHYATDGLNNLHMVSDEEMQGLSKLFQAFSVMIEKEAKRFGFPYIEMSDGRFSENLDRIVAILRK